eukprot:CAMPEP_0113642832 /NCGR_PEP_ID=MMETSP0017_2-20120614/22504_1 /TAXON_ID=2856 /ORGANISM="Cylindrotheca closterium" /LENGTH=53 /DNA_ID=CAMNT_0000554281 /DNA_START=28 /DNA_END=186 /DNA_ORIENTATION=- /assembly_acc=CAM_ASM_000147
MVKRRLGNSLSSPLLTKVVTALAKKVIPAKVLKIAMAVDGFGSSSGVVVDWDW